MEMYKKVVLTTCLGILILWAIPIMAQAGGNVIPEIKTEVVVNQEQEQRQIGAGVGSSSGVSVTSISRSDHPKPFPIGAQPQFPGLITAYTGPWKDNWNIINPGLYTHFEKFWSINLARKAIKGSGIKESLYCSLPFKKKTKLKGSKGVNVSFDKKRIPEGAVPIGIVIVKGGKRTTLWHLIGKAVLEVNKRKASWLLIERLDTNYLVTSSSKGFGLALTGAIVNITGGGGLNYGTASSMGSTESEPFLQGVAYGIEESKRLKE